jgi:methionyl-tRNA formyltransferase
MECRLVFMGSPDFAVPILEALSANYTIEGVVTQPDRPSGRGRLLQSPPAKRLAGRLNLPVIQPKSLKEEWVHDQLTAWAPDLIVVAAFGQILRDNILNLPPYKCLNVHASLLPRWRGAAPIPAAILAGDKHTGATIMVMDPGVDTGPILSQSTIAITPEDTSKTLQPKISRLGAELLLETLPGYLNQSITPIDQDDSQATYAPMLKKQDGELDFTRPAIALERKIRAYTPWPGTFMSWKDSTLKVHRTSVNLNAFEGIKSLESGTKIVINKTPAVITSRGILILDAVQPAGKKIMPGRAFLQGVKDWGIKVY